MAPDCLRVGRSAKGLRCCMCYHGHCLPRAWAALPGPSSPASRHSCLYTVPHLEDITVLPESSELPCPWGTFQECQKDPGLQLHFASQTRSLSNPHPVLPEPNPVSLARQEERRDPRKGRCPSPARFTPSSGPSC